MRHPFSSIRLKWLLSGVVLSFFMMEATGSGAPAPRPERREAMRALLERMKIPGSRDLQLVVELSEPSLLERLRPDDSSRGPKKAPSAVSRSRRPDFSSPDADGYRQRIGRSQQELKQRIRALPGARVLGETETLMNAVIMRVPAEHYAAIRHLPGVRKVYFSRPQSMLLDQAAVIQNAQAIWPIVGGQSEAGKGLAIAIIDSGIDITNPMLNGDGMGNILIHWGYDVYNYGYVNDKVVEVRNFVHLLYNEQNNQLPNDEVGHGTFVAACAAGSRVDAPLATISGIAPGASLGSYKVFGTPGINDNTTTAAVAAAIDRAVWDRMDVINLSLGSLDYLPPGEDVEAVAIRRAIQAGVVVTVSAGNDGPATHTINSPGSETDAITVGSATSLRKLSNLLHPKNSELDPVPFVPSADGIALENDLPNAKLIDVSSIDGAKLGCSMFPPHSLSGSVAFIERGNCSYAKKVQNAGVAGAVAAIIYNNLPGEPLPMTGLAGTSIPAGMISNANGLALKQYISADPAAAFVAVDGKWTYASFPVNPRMVSGFSSSGPSGSFGIKPDLVAVGENIYSATEKILPSGPMYDASGFMVSQGTSFSSGMVAGAAAILHQHFPALESLAIKSLLTNTADPALSSDGVTPASVLSAGAGFLNIANAMAAQAVFAPTSVNFGVHSYRGTLSLSSTLSIENISSTAEKFTLGLEPVVAGPEITFSRDSVEIEPGSKTSVDVALRMTAPGTGGFQGFITVKSASTSFVYRIPYWAGLYVPDSTKVLTVSQSESDSGSYRSLADAIAAAQPGNIIEIADSGVYPAGPGGLTISTNREGLPLHGLTLRAKAGETPTIDGNSPEAPWGLQTVHVIGLENILIKGLRITGGYIGLKLLQPSTDNPLSVTVDNCEISDVNGSADASGIWIDGGGRIEITHSTVKNSSGTGIVSGAYADGTRLTLLNTTVRRNGLDGLDAIGSSVDISNSTFESNHGIGLLLDACEGTVRENTIKKGYVDDNNPLADGIQIIDGNIEIKKNTISDNKDAGIALFYTVSSGPAVHIISNRMTGNGPCGIYVEGGGSIETDGNLIADNECGIYLEGIQSARLANDIIVRSKGMLSSGFGIWSELNCRRRVDIINSTIYRNAGEGVSDRNCYIDEKVVSVLNSIVAANGRGDLSDAMGGDRNISVINSVISRQPAFVNPASYDFTLASDSDQAVDQGSDSAAGVPFLDYAGRLRKDTDWGKISAVDCGAMERDSSYALMYPLIVNGAQDIFGKALTTGVVFANPEDASAQLNVAGFDNATDTTGANPFGVMLPGSENPSVFTVKADGQLAILDYQLFGFGSAESARGSAMSLSDTRLAGFYLICDPEFRSFCTGANASSRASRDLIFMRHQSDSAGTASYVIYNPWGVNGNIKATLYDQTGRWIAQQNLENPNYLGHNGQHVFKFDTMNLSSGYVRIESEYPVVGVEILEKSNSIAALGGFEPEASSRLYFPHFAVGGSYSTQVGIVNINTLSSVKVTLQAYDESGRLLGSRKSITVPKQGQLLESVNDLLGISPADALKTGYLIAESDRSGIMGFTEFSYSDGLHFANAMIPADSTPRKRLLFSHIAQGINAGSGVPYQTGIALLNPFGTEVPYTIKAYDSQGNLVGEAHRTIGPHQQQAKILMYPEAGVGFITKSLVLGGGHVEVTTDYGLVGLELFFTEDVSQLASVPAQIID